MGMKEIKIKCWKWRLSYSFVNWMDRAKERFSECTNKSIEKIQIDTKQKEKKWNKNIKMQVKWKHIHKSEMKL